MKVFFPSNELRLIRCEHMELLEENTGYYECLKISEVCNKIAAKRKFLYFAH